MHKSLFTVFAFLLAMFLLRDVSAGSNGDSPQEGQDWIITQDTHVWDEDVSVKDIILSPGKTLKLDVVNLTAQGEINLEGDSVWTNSTVYHEQVEVTDNISIYNKLELINTNLTIKASKEYTDTNANKIYLHEGSLLIIRDFDRDPTTTFDRSIVRTDNSHIDNLTLKVNYTIDIGSLVKRVGEDYGPNSIVNTNIQIENSHLEYINAIRLFGDNSKIHNTTFEKCNVLNIVSNNFTFLSNTFTNSTIENWLGYIGGNDTTIANNVLKDVPAGFVSWDSERIFLDNNTCDGLIASCFRLIGINNSTISNNNFQNITDWTTVIITDSNNNTITDNFFHNSTPNGDTFFLTGDNNLIDNNYFYGCGANGEWWQECIQISQDDNREAYGNRVTNNKFLNVSGSGIAVTANVNNTIISNNIFEGRGDTGTSDYGIMLVMYNGNNDPYLFAPSDTTVVNNTIRNFSYGIGGDYWNYGDWGHNNLFKSNYIENTNAGIFIWSLYDDTVIKDNSIHATHYSNDTAVGWVGIYIKSESSFWARNTTVSNNTIYSDRGPGILSDNNQNITITKNIVTVVVPKQWLGNAIMARESIEVNVTHNKISTNMSSLSTDAGIFIYGGSDIFISNNEIDGAIGIEASNVGFSSGTLTDIANNTIRASNYGIISNRTDSNIVNNTIIGLCEDSSCKLLNFDKVSKYGIFTQESVLNTEKNNITFFYESFAGFLSEFNITDTYIAHTQIGVKGNNSDVELYNSTITNSFYSSVFLYKSGYESVANNFTNFDKGIYSLNSTLSISNDDFTDGDVCLDLIDSEYNFDSNLFDCRIDNLIIRYNIQVKIADESGQGFEDYQFEIHNSKNDKIIDEFTGSSGYSNYYLLDVYKLNSEGLEINYNPFSLIYLNNEVEVIHTKNISYNQTLLGLLDTTPPVSELSGNSTLSSEEKIFLNLNLVGEYDDFSNYTIEYLVNEEFAEWATYGVYNNTPFVEFFGEDGKEYRFRVISRDIYGNVEHKESFEYQVKIDTSTPETFFTNFNEDYYFTGAMNLDLSWFSDDDDVLNQTLQIFYTNFTNPYLNPNSVNWFISEEIIFDDQDSFVYEFKEEGHYGFKILSTDFAGNLENKNKFDVIFNYDSNSDTLTFGDIPKQWGEDSLTIEYTTSSFNLDFDLFISLEAISEESNYLTWYKYEYESESNMITLKGLRDDTRYYFYAVSRDLAGNIEDPLNSTEYFSSNGLYDQAFSLKYIPLLDWEYHVAVEIDDNLDGEYETLLVRGLDQSRLKSNEYFLDLETNAIVFGGLSNGGFVPSEDINDMNNVRVSYAGVQGTFEVYTGQPESASSLNIVASNTTELVITFVIPKDSKSCKVQRTTNISKGYFNEKIIEPCPSGLVEYIHTNPDLEEEYFYQILIENEFGHESISENRSIDMKDVVKLFSTTDDTNGGLLGMDSIIPLTALVGVIMLGFGGVLLYRSKSEEIIDDNVNVIESKPVAKYKVEELYLIYKDGRLVKNLSDVEVKTDSDIMSGMLTAINDFVQDSFNTEGDLGSIDYGNNKIILQRGTNSYLAAVVYGEVDKFFKGKMINAVRNIENVNPSMGTWNGDAETIVHTEHYLQPIIDETKQSTKEMVDNYFSEKEIVLTTSYDKMGDIIELQVHLSNYSSSAINNCKLIPEYNSLNLSLLGIDPDVFYSFSDNSFVVGELESYNEVTFKLKLQMKVAGASPLEIKMNYEQKGRKGVTNSLLEII